MLRLLFSRVGQPFVGYSNVFSFNDPQGMCPECNGIGRKIGVDLETFLDTSKSLNEGAILFPEYAVDSWGWNILRQSGLFDNDKKLADYTDEEMELLLHSKPYKVKIEIGGKSDQPDLRGHHRQVHAQVHHARCQNLCRSAPRNRWRPTSPIGPCPLCKGARLSQAALSCKINGHNIAELSAMEVGELIEVIRAIKDPVAAPMVDTLTERLQHLVDIGLEYLSLNRETDTLSGGESQRVKIVKHLSSSLMDVMYIFDEPSVGLHPRDVHRLNELLQKLRDKGNTVIVVEHDPDVIKVADHIVDVGPHAGSRGGTIVYEGSFAGLLNADTLTGKYMKQSMPIKDSFRTAKGKLPITNAKVNNLQNVSVDIPTGVLTVVTGVAGSGKSSLINQVFLRQHPEAIVIDQSAVGVSTRSNPATYTGIMDDVRKAFATANKVSAVAVQLQLQRRLRKLPGVGRDLHRSGLPGRGQNALRNLRRQALQGRSAGLQTQRQIDHRCAGDDRSAGARLLRRSKKSCASCKP